MKYLWLSQSIQHPWKTVLFSMVLILAASVGVKELVFNGDYNIYFEDDNPQRVAFEKIQAVFNKNETANILIVPKEGDIYTPRTLQLIAQLTEQAWQTPLSIRVDSVANFQYSWSEEDDMTVEELITDPEDISSERIEWIKTIVGQEPNLRDRLVASSGKAALIVVTANLPEGDKSLANAEIVNFIKALTTQFSPQYPDHKFYHTGVIFMNSAFESEAKADAQTLVPLMFLVIILVLWLMLRSLSGMFATLIVVVTTITCAMGLAGWAGFDLTTATVNVPTLVMTLAVADCVHIIASMLYEMRQGKNKKEAIIVSMELNFKPVLITSATTAIGFLTLNFSNVPALADLGTVTAVGVMIAFILSITLLPALLNLLPLTTKPVSVESKNDPMVSFGEWVITHHKAILPFTLVIAIAATAASFLNKINDVPIEYFDQTTEFKIAADKQNELLGGMSTIDFGLFSEVESGINQPEFLSALQDFVLWLRAQPEVDHVASIADTFLRLNKNMHGDDLSYYRLPESQDMAAQFLLLYEMSLPYNLDLNNQLNIDKSGTRVSVTMKNLGSKEFTEFEDRAEHWLKQRAPQIILSAGSQNLMFAHIGEANMNSMLKGTVVALVLISLILVFALGSWRMGAISLIPNLLPAGIGFGIWGLYSGQINMALSVVLSMALGIIVDDTVHFLSKYKHARTAGKDSVEAVRYAFKSVGHALFITTIVLTLGFSVLTFSTFALNADMGLLTGIIIVVALAVDFLFLPAFLLIFDKKDFSQESEHAKHQLDKA